MKIIEKSNVRSYPTVKASDVPVGTVFRYGDHSYGPYLMTNNGIVNLALGSYCYTAQIYSNYLPYPNAELVLEK